MTDQPWERRQADTGRRATDQAPAEAVRPIVQRPRVLVVHADPGFCLEHSLHLRAAGCKVFAAHDGHAALAHAGALLPDVIVMDLKIPYLDGCEVMQRLSELVWTRRIPVIAVGADPDSRARAFEAGCAAYLEKPCAPEVCWAQIRALLKFADRPAGPTPR